VKVTVSQALANAAPVAPGPADNTKTAEANNAVITDDPPKCPSGVIPVENVQAMIRGEAQRQGADAKLALAVAGQESRFGQDNNSNKQARGIMQLIPSTAAQYGVKDPCDAADNIRGGIAFIKDLNAEFGGNILLMLAAYNAGQKRIYKAQGIPDIAQTVDYVAKVTNAYYEFPNALQRGRKGRGGALVQNEAPSDGTAQEIVPINQPNAGKAAANQWIGGQVLYVGE